MDGVDSEQQAGQQRWPHATEDGRAQHHVEEADGAVQEHVHQVVAHRLEAVHQVVQPERGHCERSGDNNDVLFTHVCLLITQQVAQ